MRCLDALEDLSCGVNLLFKGTHIQIADGQEAAALTKLPCDWCIPPMVTAATTDLLSL